MSTPVETVQKPRRSRRPQKATTGPDPSQDLPADHDDSTLISSIVKSPYNTRSGIASGTVSSDATTDVLGLRNSTPSTPPRAHSAQAVSSKKGQGNNRDQSSRSGQGKRENQQLQSAKQNVPSRAVPSITPSHNTQAGKSTPGFLNGTPSKAYAGPTFHASPAASSLPLPRFFSKSVPNVDKTASLSNVLSQDKSEAASDSEGSPPADGTGAAREQGVREQSPLDIFFQADRRDKARLRSQTPEQEPPRRMVTRRTPQPEASPSQSHLGSRHHSRHPTDGSLGGVFPLEMDNASGEPRNQSLSPLGQSIPRYAPSPPLQHRATNDETEEEHRQVQTAALKQMLFSPRSQHDKALPAQSSSSPSGDGSSPPVETPRHDSSPSRKPPAPGGLASDASRAQRHATLLALAQKQIPNSYASTSKRPPSSHLRKEVMVPNSPTQQHDPDSPRTPTPFRSSRSTLPTSSKRNSTAPAQDRFGTSSGSTPELSHPASSNDESSSTTKSIEDDLRRILKLDVLGRAL